MAGQFSSARKQVVAALRSQGPLLVNSHAFAILRDSNKEIPQVGKSLGYATDALKASGHVLLAGAEGRRRNQNAYDLAISDAIYAREQNAPNTKAPGLVEPLTRADFLPPLVPEELPAVARAIVYYPVRYAMALEMGYTLRGMTHPQALFLMRAVQGREGAFFKGADDLLAYLCSIQAAPYKVPLTSSQIEMRDRMKAERALSAQYRRENGDLGKYGPYESYAEMLAASGESAKRGKGETIGEAAARVRSAAMAAWEGRGGFDKGKRG